MALHALSPNISNTTVSAEILTGPQTQTLTGALRPAAERVIQLILPASSSPAPAPEMCPTIRPPQNATTVTKTTATWEVWSSAWTSFTDLFSFDTTGMPPVQEPASRPFGPEEGPTPLPSSNSFSDTIKKTEALAPKSMEIPNKAPAPIPGANLPESDPLKNAEQQAKQNIDSAKETVAAIASSSYLPAIGGAVLLTLAVTSAAIYYLKYYKASPPKKPAVSEQASSTWNRFLITLGVRATKVEKTFFRLFQKPTWNFAWPA